MCIRDSSKTMNFKRRRGAQRRAKTPKDAQTENFETFFWKLAKLPEEVAGARVGYQKTHKIQTLNPYISLFKILLILRKLRKLRNDKVNSFLLFGNRTKIDEKSPLFGGPYRNSHQQFFYSPISRAWSICTPLHLQVHIQINGCARGTTARGTTVDLYFAPMSTTWMNL